MGGFVIAERASGYVDVELHRDRTWEASGEFEVTANVNDPDENAQDRRRGHPRSIGWVPGLCAVAAGARVYLL